MNNTSYANESVDDLLSAYIAEKFASEQRRQPKPKARKDKFYSDNVERLSEIDVMNFDGTVIIIEPAAVVDEDIAA